MPEPFPFTAVQGDSLRRCTFTLGPSARTIDLTVTGRAGSLPGQIIPVLGLRLPNAKDAHGHPLLLFGLQVNSPNSRWNGDDGAGDLLHGAMHGWHPGTFQVLVSIDLAQATVTATITGGDTPAQTISGSLPNAGHAPGQDVALTIGVPGSADGGAYVPPFGWEFDLPVLHLDGVATPIVTDAVTAPIPTPAPQPTPVPLPPAPSPQPPMPTPLPPQPQWPGPQNPAPVPGPPVGWPPQQQPAPQQPNFWAQLAQMFLMYQMAHLFGGFFPPIAPQMPQMPFVTGLSLSQPQPPAMAPGWPLQTS